MLNGVMLAIGAVVLLASTSLGFNLGTLFGTTPKADIDQRNLADLGSVKGVFDSVTEDVFRAVRIAQGLNLPKRTRRTKERMGSFKDENDVYRFRAIEPLFTLCEHPVDVKTTTVGNLTYAICVSATSKASFGIITPTKWIVLNVWELKQGKEAVIFFENGIIYIAIADPEKPEGTQLLRYDLVNREVLEDYVIHSQHVSAIALWKMRPYGNKYNLATANSQHFPLVTSRQTIRIYEWRTSYFDEYDSSIGYDVRDIEPFHIRNRAFLAIANHQLSSGQPYLESEILSYDLGRRGWKSFQKIRTFGASDIESFTIGDGFEQQFFLAVANQYKIIKSSREYNVDSIIYKYAEGIFVPFQRIPTFGATRIATLQGPRGQFLMAITNFFGPVQLYQYNGWSFVPSDIQYTRGGMGPGAFSAGFHYIHGTQDQNELFALSISNPSKEVETNLFSIDFINENPLGEFYARSNIWCANAHRRLNDTKITQLTNQMDHSYFVDQPEKIVLEGDLSFRNGVSVTGTLVTHKLTDSSTGTVFDHSIIFRLEEIRQRLNGLKIRLARVKNLMAVAMKTSGPQTITGNHDYRSASFSCGNGLDCDVSQIQTTHLNDNDIANLREKVIFLDVGTQNIHAALEFQTVRVEGDLTVSGLLGGIDTSHLVTRNGNHVITGPKNFTSISATEYLVNGTVGGVKISPDAILLTTGDQIVNGEIIVEEIEVEDLEIDGTINGINLNEFYEDVVLANEKRTMTASKTVQGSVDMVDLQLENGFTINGVRIDDVWNNAVWINDFQTISLPTNFSSLTLIEPTLLSINGVSLNDVVLVNKDRTITAPQRFTATLNSVDDLHVAGSLNGITTIQDQNSDWPEPLDILVKSKIQTIYGNVSFTSVYLTGASTVLGTVAEVNVDELYAKTISTNKTQTLPGEWVFNKVEFRGPVDIRGTVDGIDIKNTYDRALKLNQPIPSTTTVIFKGLLYVDKLVCGNISGVDVTNDLVLRNQDSRISGIKTFSSFVLAADSFSNHLVNGINLSFLKDTLFSNLDQSITSHKIIEGDLVVQDLTVVGNVNGFKLEDVVLTNVDQEIYSAIEFRQDVEIVNGLNAEALQVHGLTNGITIEDMVEDTLLYSAEQEVKGKITFQGELTILPEADFETPAVNGLSLSQIAYDTVYVDTPRLITGHKTFVTNKVNVENLVVLGSIDGVKAEDISHNWMRHNEYQIITGEMTFAREVEVIGDLEVTKINGVDMPQLIEEVVVTDQPVEILGHLKIDRVILESSLTLTGQIQDVDFSSEVVLRTADNIITGHKHFASEIEINGPLEVNGLVDGVYVTDLCANAAVKGREVHLTSLTINGDVLVEGPMVVVGKVSGMDLVFLNRTLLRVDEGATIQSRLIFEELHVEREIVVEGLINEINIQELNRTYMSATLDQEVPAAITFQAPVVFSNNVVCESLTTTDHRIGEINVEELSSTVLMIEGDQIMMSPLFVEGDLHINGDLTVDSTVSGILFPFDVAVKTASNVILGPIVVKNDIRISDELILEEGLTVQQVDISEWAKVAVYKEGKFVVNGLKVFENLTIVDARTDHLIGGVNVSKGNILLSEGEQTILGDVTLRKPVTAHGIVTVDGLVNGVNLEVLRQSVVLRNQTNVIRGRKTFRSDVKVVNMFSEGRIDTLNVSTLIEQLEEPIELYTLRDQSGHRQHQIDTVKGYYNVPSYTLLYYEEVQRFAGDVLSISSGSSSNGRDFLFLSEGGTKDGCFMVTAYVYDVQTDIYSYFSSLSSGMAVGMDTLNVDGDLYLALANARPLLSCNHLPTSGLQLYRWRNNSFELADLMTNEIVFNVVTIEMGPNIGSCLAATFADRVDVICFTNLNREMKLLQSFSTPHVKSVSSVNCGGRTLLSLSNPATSSVDVYAWESNLAIFHIIQRVEGFPVSAVIFIPLENSQHSKCIMVVADKASKRSSINVYRFDHVIEHFSKIQSIQTARVSALQWLPIPSKSFLMFVLSKEIMKIFRWQGINGFVDHDKLILPADNNIMHIFKRSRETAMPHYMAFSGKVCTYSYSQQEESFSFLLKSRNKGC